MLRSNTGTLRGVYACLLLIGGMLSSGLAWSTTTTAVAQHSGKCLDVRGGEGAVNDGAPLEQWTCTGRTNQSFTLTAVSVGQFELIASNSGKCVEATGGGTQNGTGVQQAACNGQPRQLWKLVNASQDMIFEIVNVPSNRCLDVTGGPGATADGVLTELWDCTGATNQAWALTAPDTPFAAVISKTSGKCLDVTGGPGGTGNGALLEQWACTGSPNQQWSLHDVGAGQIELVAQHSNKCIDAANGGTTNGTNLQQEPCTGVASQLWTRQSLGVEGEYKLVHVPSGRCLDITGGPGTLQNGALMELWDCTGAANQAWVMSLPGTTATGTRDPLIQPFAANSVWNMPIGSWAIYVPANIPAVPNNSQATGVADIYVPMPGIDHDRIVLTPTAPLTTIAYSNAGWTGANRCAATGGSANGLPVSVPIPSSYVLPHDSENDSAAFLLADNHTLIQTQPLARCTAGGAGTSSVRTTDNGTDAELYGDGRLGSHGGSKLSAVGGSIRMTDLDPPDPHLPLQGPHHALKVEVFQKMQFHACPNSPCFIWPAFVADSGSATYGALASPDLPPPPEMKMGALLAIPPWQDLSQLGLVSTPGQELAWTLQNYGAYIVDSTGGPGFNLVVEDGANGSTESEFLSKYSFPMSARVQDNTAWRQDLQKILPVLQVVKNNGPMSIGGGGIPLQPLAPAFQ